MTPPPPAGYSEDELVEKPAIRLFEKLGWAPEDCFGEFDSGTSSLGRETKAEVVLKPRLRDALERLNPGLPAETFDQAIEALTRDRSAMSLPEANREVYALLKDGVPVTVQRPDGEQHPELVRVIDWTDPGNNDFFLASQFWVTGELYTRRADLIGFINGLPLLFIELKASHRNLKAAYDDNLRDYKSAIPQVFWHNAFIILSNGSETKVGSITAEWDHFADWKRISDEEEAGVVSLETAIRGTCERPRFLDLVENFVVFQEVRGGLIKIVAKNHQFLGVNHAIAALDSAREGRLGVFWHTQGSGKSLSMIFFSQKIHRKRPGNWTFVILTDREDLDDQIYRTFTRCGVITEKKAQAESGDHLRQLLSEDHRYVFTLIQKFRTEKGKKHPVLNERKDVIVIADEAHRTQYDTFALNMRTALPNAAFIAFTGTPLIAGEEQTKKVFGDYVSIYNFKQSVEDRATVPLYYENRVPELKLVNPRLNEDIYKVVEDADLDEEQEKKLERTLGKEYHLLTRDDRLEKVAEDIVAHFMGRGFWGKAMVVSIDKATAVKMHDKVRAHWDAHIAHLTREIKNCEDEDERHALEQKLAFMKATDMAVVVSQSQNEIEDLKKKGVDIRPHRERMIREELDEKFKDPEDPFRIVFVCAMWMTGFDAPSCSTIYLDKPMRNHTLMQTIARANRVFPQKESGLIVDYANVFRNLQEALAIYGSDPRGAIKPGETPILPKEELLAKLREALAQIKAFCAGFEVDPDAIRAATGFDRIRLLDDAVEALLESDEIKRHFLLLAGMVIRLYKAVLPDKDANALAPDVAVYDVLALKIRSQVAPPDISDVMEGIEGVLDRSIASKGYVIKEKPEQRLVDLSGIDFEALQKQFAKGRKRTEAEKLRAAISRTLQQLVRLNRTRVDYLEKFQRMIEEYNSGSINIEVFFRRLMTFAQELTEEEQRAVKEDLREEELAVFDLLTKPEIELTAKERKQVKAVAQELLDTLKASKLVLDWRKHQTTRAGVRLCIEETLDKLPERFSQSVYQQKCDAVYQHVFESYQGAGRSVYERVA